MWRQYNTAEKMYICTCQRIEAKFQKVYPLTPLWGSIKRGPPEVLCEKSLHSESGLTKGDPPPAATSATVVPEAGVPAVDCQMCVWWRGMNSSMSFTKSSTK